MTVIKRWIDESDAFLLILGGRYGSINPESQKSYTHLEYEYAVEARKRTFAVVIMDEYLEEKVRRSGTSMIERENTSKLNEFRAHLLGTRLVKFWSDPRDIRLAIYETLAEFSRDDLLAGWIPGNQTVDTGAVAEELARLTKENSDLRRQLSEHGPAPQRYRGLTFAELHNLLSSEKLILTEPKSEDDTHFVEVVKKVAEQDSESRPTIAHALWMLRKSIIPGIEVPLESRNILDALRRFEYYGLVRSGDLEDSDGYGEDFTERELFEITEDGHQFVLRLIVARKEHAGYEVGTPDAIANAPA
jgi:hypothetical protein